MYNAGRDEQGTGRSYFPRLVISDSYGCSACQDHDRLFYVVVVRVDHAAWLLVLLPNFSVFGTDAFRDGFASPNSAHGITSPFCKGLIFISDNGHRNILGLYGS